MYVFCFLMVCILGRAWRIEYEGGIYHVLSRGNERKDIFHDARDLLVYLVWKIWIPGNKETERLSGMTCPAISYISGSMRTRMQKDSELRVKYNKVYSLCKM